MLFSCSTLGLQVLKDMLLIILLTLLLMRSASSRESSLKIIGNKNAQVNIVTTNYNLTGFMMTERANVYLDVADDRMLDRVNATCKLHCIMLCRKQRKCESVNIGPPSVNGTTVECELFKISMHGALPRQISPHPNWTLLSIQHQQCERNPCMSGGLCTPKYQGGSDDYNCECTYGTCGQNCQFRISSDLKPPMLPVINVTQVSMRNSNLTTNNTASLAADSVPGTCALSLNDNTTRDAWLRVDFGQLTLIRHVEITPPANPAANLFGALVTVVNGKDRHDCKKVKGDNLLGNCFNKVGTHAIVKRPLSLEVCEIVVRGVYTKDIFNFEQAREINGL